MTTTKRISVLFNLLAQGYIVFDVGKLKPESIGFCSYDASTKVATIAGWGQKE